MALPKNFTEIDTNGSGMSDSSVSRASIDTIIASATTNVSSVLAEYITDGPIIIRTALRSLVARDIRSPVRCVWKIRERQRLQVREEVVPHVVLDVARRADENAPHQEPEHAADEADGEQQRAVAEELRARDAARQVVDGVAQHHRRHERDAVVTTTQPRPSRNSRR